MRILPILFSAPMVRAILREIEQPGSGKTQTRRVLNPQPDDLNEGEVPRQLHITIGDRLYVREAWHAARSLDGMPPRDIPHDADVEYAATARSYAEIGLKGKLRPAMFLPRWASRITLIVTDVRVERLQDITWQDAKAEGISGGYHQSEFATLWDSINGDRPGCAWLHNPWVAAYTFRPILGNVDALEADAA